MLITIGAPIKEVMMLIGKFPFGKIWEIHKNKSMEKTPNKTTKTYNLETSVCLKRIRQICGIANPIKATGPTKAVAEAVKMAEAIKINHRVFLMLMPIVWA